MSKQDMEKLSESFQTLLKNFEEEKKNNAEQIAFLKCSLNEMNFNKMNGKKDKLEIKFAPLSKNAQPPLRGSKYSAGIDLRSAYSYIVPANGNKLIKTDWKIQYPSGYFGRILSRSGLSVNHHIEAGAGVCDEDYTGNTGVILNNLSDQDFRVQPGDRVAQLVCLPYITPEIVYCNETKIHDTERGASGFGSTGIN